MIPLTFNVREYSMSVVRFKKFKSLLLKSALVEREIEDEARRKNPNWIRLLTLKKQRLIIKDALQRLRRDKPRASFS